MSLLRALRQNRISTLDSVAPAILIAIPANANMRPATATKAAPAITCPRSGVFSDAPTRSSIFGMNLATISSLPRLWWRRRVVAQSADERSGRGYPPVGEADQLARRAVRLRIQRPRSKLVTSSVSVCLWI